MSPGCTDSTWKPNSSRQWKSEESTQHYLTQILLAIYWRYWQAGKNARMRMRVQGRLMQARFIEIHQVVAKERKVGHFSNLMAFLNYCWPFFTNNLNYIIYYLYYWFYFLNHHICFCVFKRMLFKRRIILPWGIC